MISSQCLRVAALALMSGLIGAGSMLVWAQKMPGGNYGNNSGANGSMSREEIERLGGPTDKQGSTAAQATSPAARAKARLQSDKLAKALQLSCEVSDARLVVAGQAKVNGKEVDSTVYEVACGNGAGYLIEAQGQERPVGISCLAAEGARAADAAQGKETKFVCSLPQNKDVKVIAAALMKGAGTSCGVREVRWFGRSTTTESEYSEIVCDDSRGFLLRTAAPGAATPTQVFGCADAAKQGLKCRLTDSGPSDDSPTLDTFKEALARNGVTCNIERIRQIGQEQVRKRYVIEYACAGQSTGTVAFVPLAGNSNAYESMDCKAAVLRSIACQFLPPPQ
jgi:uncharacterized Zn-binding protein involved in type VI secretion